MNSETQQAAAQRCLATIEQWRGKVAQNPGQVVRCLLSGGAVLTNPGPWFADGDLAEIAAVDATTAEALAAWKTTERAWGKPEPLAAIGRLRQLARGEATPNPEAAPTPAEALPLGERLRRAFPVLTEDADLCAVAVTMARMRPPTRKEKKEGSDRLWKNEGAEPAMWTEAQARHYIPGCSNHTTWKGYLKRLMSAGVVSNHSTAKKGNLGKLQVNIRTDM